VEISMLSLIFVVLCVVFQTYRLILERKKRNEFRLIALAERGMFLASVMMKNQDSCNMMRHEVLDILANIDLASDVKSIRKIRKDLESLQEVYS